MSFFPADPTVGQTVTIGSKTWSWNGSAWIKQSSGGAAAAALNTTIGPTAPENPNPGDIWIDDTDGAVYTYFDDGDTEQWIDIGQPGPAGPIGYTGSQGQGADVYDNVTLSTGFISIPTGNTEQRPDSPATGSMRFNITTGFGEVYNADAGEWLQFGSPPSFNIEYLVVAGGGGGGYDCGGGGGAGGFLSTTTSFKFDTTYNVTVGAGGTGGTSGAIGTSGSNSSIGDSGSVSIIAYGGGTDETDGGSGGGGQFTSPAGKGVYPGSTYINADRQGYDGGAGALQTSGTTYYIGGGGGGSSNQGGNGTSNSGGAGGPGTASSITGSSVTYAGGGGGGGYTGGGASGGAGGSGGGGNGGGNNSNGVAASPANRGSGGGGGGGGPTKGVGAAGSSGIIVLKYPSIHSAAFSSGLVVTTQTVDGMKTSVVTAGTGTVVFSKG